MENHEATPSKVFFNMRLSRSLQIQPGRASMAFRRRIKMPYPSYTDAPAVLVEGIWGTKGFGLRTPDPCEVSRARSSQVKGGDFLNRRVGGRRLRRFEIDHVNVGLAGPLKGFKPGPCLGQVAHFAIQLL